MSFVTFIAAISIILSGDTPPQDCQRYLDDPKILVLARAYHVEAKVEFQSRENPRVRCEIDGKRRSLTNTQVFDVFVDKNEVISVSYELDPELDKARGRHGDQVIDSDVRLAEAFIRLWREKSKCVSPRISTSRFRDEEWFMVVECEYIFYKFDMTYNGNFVSLTTEPTM